MSEILNKNVLPRFICEASSLLCGFCNALSDFQGDFGRFQRRCFPSVYVLTRGYLIVIHEAAVNLYGFPNWC